jgi:ACS family hexuronate transporter-like MFS transporter
VLAVLAPTLQHAIGWNERQYSWIVASFQVAYSVGLTVSGGLIDRFGTRVGYAVVIATWSLAAMSHSLANTVLAFAICRFALGLGESGNFPAAIKTVAEWFPRWERSSATGIFNAGTNLGAIIAPLVVPILTLHFGWHAAFLFSGFLSAAWLVTWLRFYRVPEQQPRLSAEEFAYIRSGSEDTALASPRWVTLLARKQTWAYSAAKFLTDPVWWFFLFWLPKFLNHNYGITLIGLGLPLILIYLASDVGSIGGGWLPAALTRRGMPLHRARFTAMAICAFAVTPIIFAAHASSEWTAVAIIGLAAAAHQGWSANLYTLASDMFPQAAVGAVTGIGGSCGAAGGVLFALVAGEVLQKTGHYWPLFAYAAGAYLVSLIMLRLVVPGFDRVHFPVQAPTQS